MLLPENNDYQIGPEVARRLNDLSVPFEFFNKRRANAFFIHGHILRVEDIGNGRIFVTVSHKKTGKLL